MDDNIQVDPAGFHLIPLPFADDIRQPTVDQSAHCELLVGHYRSVSFT
jgi:hypothetical protein